MRSAAEVDPLDDLIGQTPEQVQRWMASKAALADGHPLGLPVCGPGAVALAIEEHISAEGDWLVQTDRNAWSAASVAQVGLLRELAGAPLEQIGQLLDLGYWAVQRRLKLHRALVNDDPAYAERTARIARSALDVIT